MSDSTEENRISLEDNSSKEMAEAQETGESATQDTKEEAPAASGGARSLFFNPVPCANLRIRRVVHEARVNGRCSRRQDPIGPFPRW